MATIIGTSSAETLGNNAGQDDTITGLAGHDIFVYSRSGASETDVVTDFGSTYFANTLDGAQAGVVTSASGTFDGALNRDQTAFTFSISVTGLDFGGQTPGTTADDVTGAHFHVGAPGVSGGIVFGFINSPNNDTNGDTVVTIGPTTTITGKWDANEGNSTTLTAQLANLLSGNLYVNFHTVAHPPGEIRGQVLAVDSGLDRIDVSGANIGDFATMQFLISDVAGSAEFTTTIGGTAHTMRLQGVTEAHLTSADFIFAGTVNESITGTTSADDLFGAGGLDTLNGAAGNDRLFGEADADTLMGGMGNDLLMGGAGADRLQGQGNKDTLVGGMGADRFVFMNINDSKVGAMRDVIADFRHAQIDKIDLRAIDANTNVSGDQAFFLGGSVFTGTAGELIQVSTALRTIVSGDVNGDGVADFQIELTGNLTLVSGDFML